MQSSHSTPLTLVNEFLVENFLCQVVLASFKLKLVCQLCGRHAIFAGVAVAESVVHGRRGALFVRLVCSPQRPGEDEWRMMSMMRNKNLEDDDGDYDNDGDGDGDDKVEDD